LFPGIERVFLPRCHVDSNARPAARRAGLVGAGMSWDSIAVVFSSTPLFSGRGARLKIATRIHK